MAANKNKGLPKEIKEMVLRELVQELNLNEVKPFRDEKLVSQFHDKTKNIFYLATNDSRYPTEIVLWDMPKKQFIFVYGQMGKFTSSSPTERVSANKLSKTHWVWPYHAAVADNQPFPGETMQQRIARTEKGWKGEGTNEAKVSEGTDKKLDKLFQASKLADIRMGEDGLYKLAMAWEDWNTDNDDQYDDLVDPLFAAVEMVQDDTSAGKAKATRMLKQFQKDVVQAMKGHEDVPDEKEMSLINKARAKAALKQIKSGKRDDGMGKFTDRLFGLNSAGNWMQINDPSDLGFYRKFGLAESILNETKSAKQLKAEYEKAIKKEQALSSLMLINLEKYMTAQAKGNYKSVAKFTKIAGQLSPKKKAASAAANDAYQAYEDKISGLHADAELQIDEAVKKVTKQMWDKMDDDGKVNALLTAMSDPGQAEDAYELAWEDLPDEATQNMYLSEANINWTTLHKDNQDYKYKKYVTDAFDKISDAMFEFRNAMGVKQLGQADPKLKKRLELMQAEIFALRRDMKSKGLTEGKLTEGSKANRWFDNLKYYYEKGLSSPDLKDPAEKKAYTKLAKQFFSKLREGKLDEMDINDPVLVAMRAFKTQLKQDKLKPKPKKISMDKYYKLMDMESDLIDQMKDAAKELAQLDSDMNADAGQKGDSWSDDDANRYGGDLDILQTKYEKLAAQKVKVKKAIMNYRIN